MLRLIIGRLFAGILTMVAASAVIFVTMELLPGDAATAILQARSADEAALQAMREELGLTRPAIVRYGDWLGGLATLDFGRSFANGVPVVDLIGPKVNATAILLAAALVLMFPFALAIGVVTALRNGRLVDTALQGVMLIFASTPSFVVGIVLILAFSMGLGLLPAVSLSPTPAAIVLPVVTLVLGWAPLTARMIRAGIIEVLDSDYVQMARLKGLPERLVLRRHILPNALVPGIQAFALTAASMPAGIVIVEYLFSYPGLGNALVQAVQLRDTVLVEAIIVILVAVYVVANLLSDIATVLLTPRLKTAASA
jgi:peptide/nickel transport system permease protein